MSLVAEADTQALSRRLKAETTEAHAALDAAIMAKAPFASREAYGHFLVVQHAFHAEIDRLINDVDAAVLPRADRRFGQIEADLADLGLAPAAPSVPRVFEPGQTVDPARALGWLYVAEGSNLGAAFLLKAAAGLGLDEAFGARHLAGAPEGRGARWRAFSAALDAVPLDPAGETRAIEGAREAFAHVRALVDVAF
ncbi:biliverdin-producing heme oxygenase [Hansschlegelia quercus]|uniref:Biliverdin-producing heme oxygenase n=1 Tax=Hansschlegelia quercus TaxID=2528245 RepID=A0A4Q9GNU1_9HYPH|nr:biliverdin-producing heme oxygenase [Hansschlegelia quercus]TBN54855.1 biliverdin-producing heme oxygenase [Hansschlegelia quercus]